MLGHRNSKVFGLFYQLVRLEDSKRSKYQQLTREESDRIESVIDSCDAWRVIFFLPFAYRVKFDDTDNSLKETTIFGRCIPCFGDNKSNSVDRLDFGRWELPLPMLLDDVVIDESSE